MEQKKTACEAFDKTDFHSRQISVGDKLPPGQQQTTFTAQRANTTNTAFTRPDNKVLNGSYFELEAKFQQNI